jgi:putative transposase
MGMFISNYFIQIIMEFTTTYKFRVYPNKKQIDKFKYILYLSRKLYNAMLEQRKIAYGLNRDFHENLKVDKYAQDMELAELKKYFPEYKEVYSQVLQNVSGRLDKAYDNFFRRIGEKKNGKKIKAGFPRFKSRERYNSITYPQSGFKIMDNTHLYLSKIGTIRMFKHREIKGNIKQLTIKRDKAENYFATFVVEGSANNIKYSEFPYNPLGIDVGLIKLIATTDNDPVDPPKYLRKSEKKLKKAYRNLSRKQKGSVNRMEARVKVARISKHIANQRNDFSQKLSRKIVNNHNFIAYEDLNIENMMKNHKLAKSIADASWGELIKNTIYKAERAGKYCIKVNPRNTSKQCSYCGNIIDDQSLDDREYHCINCGLIMDRDDNAAVNVLNAGLKNIFNTFIIIKPRKSKHKRRVPTDCGELMPVEELANTFGQASPVEARSPNALA